MSVRIEGLDRLNAELSRVAERFDREATRLVNRTAQNIRNDAVRLVLRSTPTGRVYEKSNPRRTHRASAPGEPPATDTGRLAGSIRVQESGGPQAAVEAQVDYAIHLEFGTRHMAARPFMTPATAANLARYQAGLRDLTRKAARK